MNTSPSAPLLRENESGWRRSGTFKNYKQRMESSQREKTITGEEGNQRARVVKEIKAKNIRIQL